MGLSFPLGNNPGKWFCQKLLKWYQENKRDLPWRRSRDPYIIWVSEIIFQQTRIDQGMAYFHNFVTRFPSLKVLAEAPEQEVLNYWQGLGYYNRARNMHASAQQIYQDQNGIFPTTHSEIVKMKGVGDYTASMIASVCFDEATAAVDGNVFRVLSRMYADSTPIDKGLGKAHFKELAQNLLDAKQPGDHNQALMELGAKVCLPRNPDCENCPVQEFCQGKFLGTQLNFPVKAPKRPVSEHTLKYYLFLLPDGFFISKRPSTGIWPGLFELPLSPFESKAVQQLAEAAQLLTEIKHKLTHQTLYIQFFSVSCPSTLYPPESWIKISPHQIKEYPFPKPIHTFLTQSKS